MTRPRLSRLVRARLLRASVLLLFLAGSATPAGASQIGDVPPPPPRPPSEARPAGAGPEAESPARATRKGGRLGAVIGSISGLAFFLFVGLVADALEEGEEEFGAGEYFAIGLFGAASGAAAGWLVGTHAGGMIHEDGPAPTDSTAVPAPPARREAPIGSVTLQAGGAAFTERDSGAGLLLRGTILSHWKSWIATGLEVDRMWTTPGAWRVAGAFRLDATAPDARFRPYAAGSLGGNFWEGSESLVSADTGLGLEWRTAPRWSLGVEARYHWNLQNAVEPGTYRFTSLAAGWRTHW